MNTSDSSIQRLVQDGFLMTTPDAAALPPENKARLNLKGNQLFNQGAVEQAKKIFMTTRYSDGLCRVGDYYSEKADLTSALKFYTLSGRKDKSEPLIQSALQVIRSVMKDDDLNPTENKDK